jgi:hypothetical protein
MKLPLSSFGRACPRCAGTGVLWGGPWGLTAIEGCPDCDGWGYKLKEEEENGKSRRRPPDQNE